MTNPRDNLTDSERKATRRETEYSLWLVWSLPASLSANRQWFRTEEDRDAFAEIFRAAGASIDQGKA